MDELTNEVGGTLNGLGAAKMNLDAHDVVFFLVAVGGAVCAVCAAVVAVVAVELVIHGLCLEGQRSDGGVRPAEGGHDFGLINCRRRRRRRDFDIEGVLEGRGQGARAARARGGLQRRQCNKENQAVIVKKKNPSCCLLNGWNEHGKMLVQTVTSVRTRRQNNSSLPCCKRSARLL